MGFFEQLREFELVRNSKSNYVLKRGEDESSLDKFFCLSNITLNPDEHHLYYFASMCYLFGLLGINVTSFTAVPSGYLASFEKDGEFFGTFYSDPTCFQKVLIEEINKRVNEDLPFYSRLLELLAAPDKSLIWKCKEISFLDKSEEISSNLERALERFNEVNLKNCNDNHLILEDIVSNGDKKVLETLSKVNEIERENKRNKKDESIINIIVEVMKEKDFGSDESNYKHILEVFRAKTNYDILLNEFILDQGYYVYRGRNRKQNGTILNSQERVKELEELLRKMFPNKEFYAIHADIVDIQNMCSTDYTADIVFDIFKKLTQGDSLALLVLEKTVPSFEGHKEGKEEFRHEMGYMNQDADRDKAGRVR